MVDECVRYLDPQPGKVFVDATLGGGGHTGALFAKCPEITVFGFDQDREALAAAKEALHDHIDNLRFIKANFSQIRTELALQKTKAIDGVLFDLGVSSHQLDDGTRGFSFDRNAPLDMRMDQTQRDDARKAVNDLSQAELAKIFKEYGEELNAGRIARAVVAAREKNPLETTGDLARAVESVAGTGTKESLKAKVRIFQALRIHVNRELRVLEPALKDAINILKPGGRIVVLSYHSLEDRVVKTVFRIAAEGCQCSPQAVSCVCGQTRKIRLLNKKPLLASAEETEFNTRSRSVRLRAAEKLMGES